jgi:hypothetical protein
MKGELNMKVFQFKNPLTGQTGNVLSIADWGQGILGVAVLFFMLAIGQNFAKAVSSKVPFADSTIEPIISAPVSAGSSPKMRIV